MSIIDAYTTPGTERDTQLSASRLIRMMDKAGIDQAVIAPQDRELAVDCAKGNRRMLRVAAKSKGRFIPACAANPWSGARGIKLVREAVGGGARLIVLAPALQGFILSDELADDLCTAAGELGVPLYVHTGPHSSSAPTQLVLVALKFPATKFILAHGGTTDHAWDMKPILGAALPNLWFDVSLCRPWVVPSFAPLVDKSRLMWGSSAPRNDPGYELRASDAVWTIKDHPEFYGGNLATLLGDRAE